VAGLAARRVGGRIFRQQAGKTREMRGPLPLPSHRVAAVAACSTHPASTFPTPHSLTHSLTHSLPHSLSHPSTAHHSTAMVDPRTKLPRAIRMLAQFGARAMQRSHVDGK
jgi:hypothetical protein